MDYIIEWDKTGEKAFELGVDHVVLYPLDESKVKTKSADQYGPGVPWNGVTSISESPEGGDANDLWADNIKYASLRATETFGATVEAYTYPEEFAVLDGSVSYANAPGMYIGQQKRGKFGLCYRTRVGNDAKEEAGYKYHLIYGCMAAPSERSFETVNDSPDAITFSWEIDTTPVNMGTHETIEAKPLSNITIDETKIPANKKANLETLLQKLYGTPAVAAVQGHGSVGDTDYVAPVSAVEAVPAYLPLPDEVYSILSAAAATPAQNNGGEQTTP